MSAVVNQLIFVFAHPKIDVLEDNSPFENITGYLLFFLNVCNGFRESDCNCQQYNSVLHTVQQLCYIARHTSHINTYFYSYFWQSYSRPDWHVSLKRIASCIQDRLHADNCKTETYFFLYVCNILYSSSHYLELRQYITVLWWWKTTRGRGFPLHLVLWNSTTCRQQNFAHVGLVLTLKVLDFWKLTSYCSLKPLWSGMGEVVPARTSPTLHPPSPPTEHQLSRLAL